MVKHIFNPYTNETKKNSLFLALFLVPDVWTIPFVD